MKYIFFSLDLLDTKLTKTGNARRITKFSLKMQNNPKTPQKTKWREKKGGGGRRREKREGRREGRSGGRKKIHKFSWVVEQGNTEEAVFS